MTNLVLIIGLLGTGKTAFMSLLGLLDKLNYKLDIKANYYTDFSTKINPIEMLRFELRNCTVLLDEAHTIFDSRNSQSPLNKVFGYFFSQSRKAHVNVVCTSQLSSMVEKRIRELVPKYYKCAYRKKKEPFLITEYYSVIDKPTGLEFKFQYEELEQLIFSRYKTEEIIMPLSMDSTKVNFSNILEDFEACKTKKSFVRLIGKSYPQFVKEDIGACFDFLKNEDLDRAKRVLLSIYNSEINI